MDKASRPETESRTDTDPGRFDAAIGVLALALYVIERCLAFVFLESRSASAGLWETRLLEFFFGRPPYSIFDILAGFGPPEGMFALLSPRNILQALLQGLHFFANWWIARLPLQVILKWKNRGRE
jgi:hypothetical protein